MIRSIAKFLIQNSYDSTIPLSNADRLPRWLRRWVNSDSQLRDFERELLRFESKLIGQANAHIANGVRPTDSAIGYVRTNSTPSDFQWRSPFALAAMAAGFVCILLAGRWLSTQSITQPIEPKLTIARELDASMRMSEDDKKANLLRSTWSLTQRLALKWNQKSSEAANAIAIANQQVRDESKWIESVGLESLRFVAQKLPAASVRMLGFNSIRH